MLKTDLEAWFKEAGLAHRISEIPEMTVASIAIEYKPAVGEYPVGISRIGGVPDLPKDIKWPVNWEEQPWYFLAQVNCKQIASVTKFKNFPRQGTFYIFVS